MQRSTIWGLSLVFAAASSALLAQALFGTLVGTVVDASGSALPKASIAIANTGTNQKWELAANEFGSFTLATVPPGTYEVKVSAAGFRTYSQERITVQAGTTVRLDVRLEVGAVTESVEVNAAAVALQTDTMDVRNEIRAADLQNTPVPVSRNYQSLLVTVPGISPPTNAHSISANPSRSLVLNSNGSNAQSTAVRVDGATTWNTWLPHLSGYVPTLEAIDQVTVQSNSYEADTGFAGGASVNVQIKSGTNQFHGSGFWFHNNQHLKARPYYLPATQGQPKRILNQYGGSLGGPILKDRLFFFAAYEATPDRSASPRCRRRPCGAAISQLRHWRSSIR
jgi:Carboxypeptidase regulatory-like domain